MINSELEGIPLEQWPTDPTHPDFTVPFEITQIKEKFGTLRFYYHIVLDGTAGITDAQASRIAAAISLTEELSSTVCEVCGNIGYHCQREGWVKTLCPVCMESMGYEAIDTSEEEGDVLNTSHEQQSLQ